ncbi:hypothetical protein HYH03_003382 [Edaphochlamys debaryana]|uniref:Lipoprotein n=1 Tax=Edaphochlamys debaryana TaxID=47281 RepID=A0A835YH86_9CHLO|nr:hypothetical protein HYH03_003382 [Edaphochlamys debaryana]|eukprot:KAG2498635.1 hypothetical protein HYH03_003382 [Edaphochlamys debaryana]
MRLQKNGSALLALVAMGCALSSAIRTFGPLLAARGHGGPANAANAVVPINAAAVDVENVSAGPADAVADAV